MRGSMSFKSILRVFLPNKIQKKFISILIIEDNEVDQRVASAAVERGGYTVLKAYNGQTGLEMARLHSPDLIILDYNLPDINGPEVCKILKSEDKTRTIPVLFLTSMTNPDSILDCYEYGGENYLSKPINPKFLLKQIDLTLKDKN